MPPTGHRLHRRRIGRIGGDRDSGDRDPVGVHRGDHRLIVPVGRVAVTEQDDVLDRGAGL